MARVQFMSDLHLEMFPGFRIADAAAPYLALAGDIGDPFSAEYAAFLDDCAAKFSLVFVVLGNHEAYGRSWPNAVARVRHVVARNERLVLLDRTRHELGEHLRVVGTTLWSHVPGRCAYEVRSSISDYARIDGFGIAAGNELHDADVAWLRAEMDLAEADGAKLLVLTHHAPSLVGTSHPRFAGDELSCAFATDLEHLLRRPCVAAWIHGHTHFSHARTLPSGAVLASNQRGYADDEEETRGFDPGRCLELDVQPDGLKC